MSDGRRCPGGGEEPPGPSAAQATQAALAYLYTGRRERETLESSRGKGGGRERGEMAIKEISPSRK